MEKALWWTYASIHHEQLQKIPNRKTLSHDGTHEFWFEKFTSIVQIGSATEKKQTCPNRWWTDPKIIPKTTISRNVSTYDVENPYRTDIRINVLLFARESVATGSAGLGLHPQRWWSKYTRKNKRKMVSEKIRHFEESKRLAIAMAQPKQGAWTKWENTKDRTIKWSNIKQMERKQLSFLIKSVYDILPTPVNLKLWWVSSFNLFKAFVKIANFKHVLARC